MEHNTASMNQDDFHNYFDYDLEMYNGIIIFFFLDWCQNINLYWGININSLRRSKPLLKWYKNQIKIQEQLFIQDNKKYLHLNAPNSLSELFNSCYISTIKSYYPVKLLEKIKQKQ